MGTVLIFSPFFFPEPISTGKYNTTLAEHVRDLHDGDVKVICAHPMFPKWKVEPTSAQLPGIEAIRGGRYLKFPASVLLRRAILELWFAFYCAAVVLSLRLRKEPISTAIFVFPPSLMAVFVHFLLPKSTHRVGLIHDLQAIYAARGNGLVKRLVHSAIRSVESRSFRICNKLIFLSETMRRWTVDNYGVSAEKTAVQYPFVSMKGVAENGDGNEAIDSVIDSSSRSIVYSGALGEKQAPEELYSFMKSFVAENEGWIAYIFSQGPLYEKLHKDNVESKIVFHDLVPIKSLPYLLERSDIQIIPQASGTADGSLPSKLPNLIKAKCRILCITDVGSELESLISRYPLSKVVNTWDNAEIITAARQLALKKKGSSDEYSVIQLLSLFDAAVAAKTCLHVNVELVPLEKNLTMQ